MWFEMCKMVALDTPSNQANYHKLGKVLNSPPFHAKCKVSIMRTWKGGVMWPKLSVRSGIIWKKLSHEVRDQEAQTLPQQVLEQQRSPQLRKIRKSPKDLKEGVEQTYWNSQFLNTLFTTSLFLFFLFPIIFLSFDLKSKTKIHVNDMGNTKSELQFF